MVIVSVVAVVVAIAMVVMLVVAVVAINDLGLRVRNLNKAIVVEQK